MDFFQQFGNDLMKGDAKSWAILGGSVTAYLLLKRATAPAEDPRPAGKHIAKVLLFWVSLLPSTLAAGSVAFHVVCMPPTMLTIGMPLHGPRSIPLIADA